MTKQDNPEIHTNESIHQATKQAVEEGEQVHDRVYKITIDALSQRTLDTAAIREVIESVGKGALGGATTHGERMGDSLKQAFGGVDAALAKAAEATKLALEEAAGGAGDFTRQELKNSIDELDTLEKLYLSTLGTLAKDGSERAATILSDLIQHASNSGTAVGQLAVTAVADLQRQLRQVGAEGLQTGADNARATGDQLLQIAGGILRGIADTLPPSSKADKSDND